MYSARFLNLLLVALAATSAVDATYLKRDGNDLSPRQVDGGNTEGGGGGGDILPTATDIIPQPTSSDPPVETTPPPTESTSSEPLPGPTDSPVDTSSSEELPPVDTVPSTTPGDTTTASSSDPPSITSEPEPTPTEDETTGETSSEPTPVISTSYKVITLTNPDGNVHVTTSAALTTTTPDLNEKSDGGSGNMATNTKNTVIGVVVGIGGAILLGALGVVAWRIRARKRLAEENDGLMEYDGGYNANDKTEPTGSSHSPQPGNPRSPFQSTLETYHAPTQPVNASSNF